MKILKTLLFVSFAILVLLDIGYGMKAAAEVNTVTYVAPVVPAKPALSTEQHRWLDSLEDCESGGSAKAINPRDTDGTPSYGLLQFKPTTYAEFAWIYKLASTTDYMDPEEQEQIVIQMILKGGVDWHHQFPDCVSRLGTPPLSTRRS